MEVVVVVTCVTGGTVVCGVVCGVVCDVVCDVVCGVVVECPWKFNSVHDLFNEIDTLYDEHVTNGGLSKTENISSLSRISNNSSHQKYVESSLGTVNWNLLCLWSNSSSCW